MKTKILNRVTKNTCMGIFISILLISFSSCAVNSSFLDSSMVPAAEGKVKVKRGKNLNYKIHVKVKELAEVEKLQTDKHNYVVWMHTDTGDIGNLGQLNPSKGMFKKNLKAKLETTSSYKPTKIFITAENNSNAQSPSEQIVLTTTNF